ncbi:hypothetical protein GALMADRAFT_137304 [Galerina marginata CBS 339.88]|uniref:Uncharacterized protein n=1 Tax=Galerina marginata (strain CBS 339.88) TaxID=685588 RepID=A0A067T8I6_GALM3|nr:hypothetical protein GALMADRAFT_137304 [Galerina marginata CBS 339.88]
MLSIPRSLVAIALGKHHSPCPPRSPTNTQDLASRFSLVTPEIITIYRGDAEDQEFTERLSVSTLGASVIDVVSGVTDYAISEIDTLDVIENSVATRTLFSTPVFNSYVIERGSAFLGNSIFETIVTNPTVTFIESGFAGCSASVPQAPGVEVECFEIEADRGSGGFSSGTTIGYKAILTPVYTVTLAESNLAGRPTFPTPVTIPSPTLPTPTPTKPQGGGAASTFAGGTYLQVSLMALVTNILSFFLL